MQVLLSEFRTSISQTPQTFSYTGGTEPYQWRCGSVHGTSMELFTKSEILVELRRRMYERGAYSLQQL